MSIALYEKLKISTLGFPTYVKVISTYSTTAVHLKVGKMLFCFWLFFVVIWMN